MDINENSYKIYLMLGKVRFIINKIKLKIFNFFLIIFYIKIFMK
jgi:hypothetical protein